MKTCGHVSSRDIKKKPAGSYFVMRAGLRNNEFCLHGLICGCTGLYTEILPREDEFGYGKKRGGRKLTIVLCEAHTPYTCYAGMLVSLWQVCSVSF